MIKSFGIMRSRLSTTLIGIGSLLFMSLPTFAQSEEVAETNEFLTTSEHTFTPKELSLKVEAMAFLRDNEYESKITKGYTLAGARLNAGAQYNPLDNIHLELGLSGLFFDGANKYPNYAYHDVAEWKADQYQSGVHLLPWFRAEMKTGKVDFVLGDIYGGTEHQFNTPLYNKETMISADPEMGAQILFGDKVFKFDLFANWQSFQFKDDNHQEVFTAGLSSRLTPFKSEGWKDLSVNFQTLVQHRGGEYDIDAETETLSNFSLGIAWDKYYSCGAFNHLRLEGDVIGCYQHVGHLWAFDSGKAFHGSATMTFAKDLHTQLGYFYAPNNFVTLYGNPFFSTISLKHPELTYTCARTAYLDFGYSHTWAKNYTFGANVEVFNANPGGGKNEFGYSFGLYMIVKPEFLLKIFK